MILPLRIAGFLGAGLIRSWGGTLRVETIDGHYRVRSRPSIYVFWHGRMLALSYCFRNQAVQLLASRHRDGELMGQAVRFLGYGHVRGSSTRGGAIAIRELVRRLEASLDLGLTVDGPTGPRYVFKPGAIEIARRTGAPIVPLTASSNRKWVLSSWDAFEIPKPFSRVAVRFGEPIFVRPDADELELERTRQEAERRLRELTEVNDEFAGRR